MTLMSSASRALVVSLASTAFSVGGDRRGQRGLVDERDDVLRGEKVFGSVSETSLSEIICGVVVNTSAACTLPLVSAARVIGLTRLAGRSP